MGKTLKERFSAALIKGTTVATLLTAGGYAAAQTGSTQENRNTNSNILKILIAAWRFRSFSRQASGDVSG